MKTEEKIGFGLVILVTIVMIPIALNIQESLSSSFDTIHDFCLEGYTNQGTGIGWSAIKHFCKGQEFTCTTTECYWVTGKQENVKHGTE